MAPQPGAAQIQQALRALLDETSQPCVVAWSGGRDSTVLLHALLAGRRRATVLRAVHVDHGLQPAALDFRAFCQRTARRWRVPLQVVKVRVAVARGDSLEEAARQARRAALASALRPGEVLLTAQHADDQLETLLLALMRGAGPRGLAAMPASMSFAGTRLLRPLLGFGGAAIAAYAHTAGLEWVEDPTNADSRYDRNFLRARVLPALRERWPAAAHTAARSARHCAAASELLDAAALRDLELAADGADLEVAILRRFAPARRAAVLRAWIRRAGARAPNERHLRQIEAMMAARRDAHPELRLPDAILRRVAGRLVISV